MENRINIAELLKDCPEGMELDCTIFDNVTFEGIKQDKYPIIVKLKEPSMTLSLTETGGWNLYDSAKCVIFPKGKTSWEGFQRPFKDGDIVFSGFDLISIFKEQIGGRYGRLHSHVSLSNSCVLEINKDNWTLENIRFATEEEKQKLFKAIKDNGFRWNEETKTLEKLVNPNFKVGNKIIRKGRKGIDYPIEVLAIENGRYKLQAMSMPIDSQDEWELVSDKFDITTLKPFESRVLVRNAYGYLWKPAIYGFSHLKNHYVVGGIYWVQCIPYEENKHLIGTTDDCSDFYKTWEK